MSNPENPKLDNVQIPRKEKRSKQAKSKPLPQYQIYISDFHYMTVDTVIGYRDNNGIEQEARLGDLMQQGVLFVSRAIPYSHGFEVDE